ncbi:hypothetical protein PV379_04575 [Streptomyces caniscabiei]|uniref:hypothetical protein n=1 Tax=Streptomyces caniscabiei TaxID=2746961 RepID=UPI0029ACA0A3|nr:hypothetical protein [Streptomyces caniscabiei]MDX2776611.1 hypothetical protein [Streptomyces caniscabiei]
MKHTSLSQAEVIQNENVTAREYDNAAAKLNVAHIKITGRYPNTGFTYNREVDSVIHVLSGQGILGQKEGAAISLKQHDQIHLAAGDRYFFEGTLEVLYAATPKWTPEQAVHSN